MSDVNLDNEFEEIAEWYVCRGKKQIGPVKKSAIVKNWFNGNLRESDIVYCDRIGNWQLFKDCPEFDFIFPKTKKIITDDRINIVNNVNSGWHPANFWWMDSEAQGRYVGWFVLIIFLTVMFAGFMSHLQQQEAQDRIDRVMRNFR